jgi:hypothetical protein
MRPLYLQVGLVAVFAIPALVLRKTHYVHVHHYCWALLIPFFATPHTLSSVVQVRDARVGQAT